MGVEKPRTIVEIEVEQTRADPDAEIRVIESAQAKQGELGDGDAADAALVKGGPVNIEFMRYRHDQFGDVIRMQFDRSIDSLDMTVQSGSVVCQRIKTLIRAAVSEQSARQFDARSAKRKKRKRKTTRDQRKRNRR